MHEHDACETKQLKHPIHSAPAALFSKLGFLLGFSGPRSLSLGSFYVSLGLFIKPEASSMIERTPSLSPRSFYHRVALFTKPGFFLAFNVSLH